MRNDTGTLTCRRRPWNNPAIPIALESVAGLILLRGSLFSAA